MKRPRAKNPGQWIGVRSESRPEKVHNVYTGDRLNGVHCTCEAFKHTTRTPKEFYMCKHISEVVEFKEEET